MSKKKDVVKKNVEAKPVELVLKPKFKIGDKVTRSNPSLEIFTISEVLVKDNYILYKVEKSIEQFFEEDLKLLNGQDDINQLLIEAIETRSKGDEFDSSKHYNKRRVDTLVGLGLLGLLLILIGALNGGFVDGAHWAAIGASIIGSYMLTIILIVCMLPKD